MMFLHVTEGAVHSLFLKTHWRVGQNVHARYPLWAYRTRPQRSITSVNGRCVSYYWRQITELRITPGKQPKLGPHWYSLQLTAYYKLHGVCVSRTLPTVSIIS